MKTTFKELKAELLLKAKNNNACLSGYTQSEKCETEKELVQVIADNFNWIWQTKTMTIEDLNKFDSGLLQSVGIFANYEGSINSGLNKLIIVGTSAPRIETYGTSAPTIETYGTSAPRIETYGTSAPRIVTYDTSAPRIVTYDTSAPTIETYGTSAPRIETYGTSAPRIETYNSSAPRIITYDSSAPTIITYHSSAPRIITYDSSAPRIITYDSSAPRISGMKNCIIAVNLSLILDLDNSIIYKSDKWSVR